MRAGSGDVWAGEVIVEVEGLGESVAVKLCFLNLGDCVIAGCLGGGGGAGDAGQFGDGQRLGSVDVGRLLQGSVEGHASHGAAAYPALPVQFLQCVDHLVALEARGAGDFADAARLGAVLPARFEVRHDLAGVLVIEVLNGHFRQFVHFRPALRPVAGGGDQAVFREFGQQLTEQVGAEQLAEDRFAAQFAGRLAPAADQQQQVLFEVLLELGRVFLADVDGLGFRPADHAAVVHHRLKPRAGVNVGVGFVFPRLLSVGG
ncbi:hypothetical protein DFI_18840 (plasmid) [Deinococcus ficus]|uniref:Uncharacterized protein n=1 Tax=Deinococcus ficus TaxID=317577 RepID=A0A221T336_9DEIO|nr:hypothetical protein DFI_18840 [Deinococcus ficus]